jgi:hypothetical protein
VLLVVATLASIATLPSFAIDIPVSIDGNLIFRQLEANEQTGQDAAIEFIFEELDSSGNPTGELFSLGQSSLINHAPGSTIHVQGILRDGSLLIPNSVTLLAPPGGGGSPTCASGDQDMIVMIVNFLDKPAPCTRAQIDDAVFNVMRSDTVNTFFDENAFNNPADTPYGYGGVVTVPLTINYTSSTTCTASKLVKLADQAATAAGYTLSNYTHRAYVFPWVANSKCTDAFSDGPAARVKRFYVFTHQNDCPHHPFAHEYGHNIGLGHAGVKGDEYAETADFMGGGYGGAVSLRHNNGASKFSTCFFRSTLENWRLITDPPSGTYTLGLVSQNVTNRAETIRFRNIPITWSYNDEYFLTYRQPVGWDINIGAIGGSVHYEKTSINKFSTTKSDANWNYPMELIGFLGDGESFRDYAAGLEIKQLSHDTTAGTATIQVTRASLTPEQQIPQQTISGLGWNIPGSTWVQLTWDAPNHNTVPEADYRGFKIYRNNTEIATTPYGYFVDRGTVSGRTYYYYIRLYDDAGNLGDPTETLTVPVPRPPPPH